MNDARKYVVSALVACAFGLAAGTAQASTKVKADFNGDGFEDLAIGVPGQKIAGDISAGAVNVIYGSANGLVKSTGKVQVFFQDQPGILREFSEPDDFFGSTLAAGDFNGDGFDDLAIGVPLEDLVSGGYDHRQCRHGAHPLRKRARPDRHQRPGLGSGQPGHSWRARIAGGVRQCAGGRRFQQGRPRRPRRLACPVRSVNGVGLAGAVITIYGSATGLTATGSQFLTDGGIFGIPQFSELDDQFGFALAAGDFGGDGFDDLAIGAPREDFFGGVSTDPTDRGQVIIVLGSPTGLNTELRNFFNQDKAGILDDAEPFDRFGISLASGDFNGDGRFDLAIGIQGEDVVGASGNILETGAVAVLYGSDIGIGPVAQGNQFWHQDVAGIEDINENGDEFGDQLTTGDFNGDGRDDLAIGVPFEDLGGSPNSGIQNAGVVEVIYGTPSGLSAVNDQRWSQESADFVTNTFIIDQGEANDKFGAALAAGDFNGDGRDDLAVGVPSEDADLSLIEIGGINVIFGSPTGLAVSITSFWTRSCSTTFPNPATVSAWRSRVRATGPEAAPASPAHGRGSPKGAARNAVCWVGSTSRTRAPAWPLRQLVRFYLSMDQNLDASDVLIEQMSIDMLTPGGPCESGSAAKRQAVDRARPVRHRRARRHQRGARDRRSEQHRRLG